MVYIKQITIQGFKSYKDQTVTAPFSPKCNVIVGRNGSGKSNFFAAIRFVLSDAYTGMTGEERQALLHEGTGSAVMSAYVEIVFDNEDDRFPTGNKEVVLRRTIGLKKDEYSLDRKTATKTDVMNLLESAGFSRSNPYYIVPQGRVTALTNMKDTDRLNLLKEVAGTQVYEQRRAESLKIMDETDSRRSKIDELLKYIEERLNELEEEKEELRSYHEKDRERRCLEYAIYHREQQEINAALDQIEDARQNAIHDTEESREGFLAREKEIQELTRSIDAIKSRSDLLTLDRRQLEDERRENVRTRAQIELQINAVTSNQEQLREEKERYQRELAEITADIAKREAELEKLLPSYNEKKEKESKLRAELEEADAQRQRLYAKQGRNTQFRTKKERDDWLRKEIKESKAALTKRESTKKTLEKDIAELQTDLEATEQGIAESRKTLEGRNDAMEAHSEDIANKKEIRNRVMDERKELWREDSKLDSQAQALRKELDHAEKELSQMMDVNTARGLKAVERIRQRLGLTGCYGTLAELMDVDDKYKTAVEVTAGSSLFHYVVDNDDTATTVLTELNKERSGRITFMPLNRLHPREAKFPSSNDVIPMIEKLSFDRRFKPAFEQVFGKTIICPDLNIASQYARSNGLNAITLAGDQANRKGALTGGFHDPRRSRLEAVKTQKRIREEYNQQRALSDELKRRIADKDAEITAAVSELQKAEAARSQADASYGPLRTTIQSLVNLASQRRETLERKQATLETSTGSIKTLNQQLTAYQTELAGEFKKSLTSEEESLLESLARKCQTLRTQLTALTTSLADEASRKSTLEVELNSNLRMRLDQLKGQPIDSSSTSSIGVTTSTKELNRDLKRIDASISAIEQKLAEADSALSAAVKELSQTSERKQALEQAQLDSRTRIDRHKKRMEKSMAKRALLNEKAAECQRNIRDLGVLPDEAFGKYLNVESNRVVKRLHKVNEALKGFSHVNKKAFEQYNNFTKQRDTLQKRREELDTSRKSIEELIEVLDQRKDEAIERTFRQVSKEFTDIFKKLVPAGIGKLVMQRKVDSSAPAVDDESDTEAARRAAAKSVQNYIGVGISVSFNSEHDEQQRIGQLSGGQKSLCALGLIFAIQRCDPAPFYLFDEVDANLDDQYRTAVAKMVWDLSRGDQGQFICTTFRPELVRVADQHYGVFHQNRTSSVHRIEKEEALRFVDGEKTA
ncbi:chromosome segregation protein sudA [Ascodesmis nigricans]|uniref:Structural maintenance of chromosomes protein n=1 Tax=Ascodesmis nigricans TaxID=341454 RepID=A0A4S2N7W7_9PEZI|nr:chromosome segregation protein sudA [Ascodesmis nigricans]